MKIVLEENLIPGKIYRVMDIKFKCVGFSLDECIGRRTIKTQNVSVDDGEIEETYLHCRYRWKYYDEDNKLIRFGR